jgi:hypothetical protein
MQPVWYKTEAKHLLAAIRIRTVKTGSYIEVEVEAK